jgi:hypothetical protein
MARIDYLRGDVTCPPAPPIRYEAVDRCLRHLAARAAGLEATGHMPGIGCGLAGGRWDRIEPLIVSRLIDCGVSVSVYDLVSAD